MTATATRVWDKVEDGWRYEEPKPVTAVDVTIVPIYGVRTRGEIITELHSNTDHTPLTMESITAQAARRQWEPIDKGDALYRDWLNDNGSL